MGWLVPATRGRFSTDDPGPPPPEGPLKAVPHGWRLRRVDNALPFGGLPRGMRWFAWGASLLPPVIGVAGAIAFSVLSPSAVALLLGLTPLVATPFLAARLSRWHLSRLMEAGGRFDSLSRAPRGARARVVGTVRAGPCFTTAGRGQPAVVSLYAGFRELCQDSFAHGPATPYLETRGIDFTLELDSGECVRIEARDLFLADLATLLEDFADGCSSGPRAEALSRRSRTVAAGTLSDLLVHEVSIGPGDRIEVLGVVDHEISADADAAPGRGVRLTPVLRAGGGTPLLVRSAPVRPRLSASVPLHTTG